jgi:hypothetical protein
MGRHKSTNPRHLIAGFNVTQEELDELHRRAKRAGYRFSEWARVMLLEVEGREAPPKPKKAKAKPTNALEAVTGPAKKRGKKALTGSALERWAVGQYGPGNIKATHLAEGWTVTRNGEHRGWGDTPEACKAACLARDAKIGR